MKVRCRSVAWKMTRRRPARNTTALNCDLKKAAVKRKLMCNFPMPLNKYNLLHRLPLFGWPRFEPEVLEYSTLRFRGILLRLKVFPAIPTTSQYTSKHMFGLYASFWPEFQCLIRMPKQEDSFWVGVWVGSHKCTNRNVDMLYCSTSIQTTGNNQSEQAHKSKIDSIYQNRK